MLANPSDPSNRPAAAPLRNFIAEAFFQPLSAAAHLCPPGVTRDCSALPDEHLLRLAVLRCMGAVSSGRDFLQTFHTQTGLAPENSTFFEALKSTRRLEYFAAMAGAVRNAARRSLPDALASFSGLNGWDIYGADGHFWEAATHDKKSYRRGCKDNEAKFATGNVFSLCLRTHTMTHLALGDQEFRRKEHDISALKRLDIKALRQGAAAGRKVLYAYDRAIIDFSFWYKAKQSGVYFITRTKSNLRLDVMGINRWDREDPLNAGVISDELVSGGQFLIRKVVYQDPNTSEVYEYITNVTDQSIPPGIIAMIYKLRWDIEKVFDETKIKLGESKAWASSANAKRMQALAVCLTHNLMLLYEQKLEREEAIRNEAEIRRRADRLEKLEKAVAVVGRRLNAFVQSVQRITQRSVKFIRWLRTILPLAAPPAHAYDALRKFYRCL